MVFYWLYHITCFVDGKRMIFVGGSICVATSLLHLWLRTEQQKWPEQDFRRPSSNWSPEVWDVFANQSSSMRFNSSSCQASKPTITFAENPNHPDHSDYPWPAALRHQGDQSACLSAVQRKHGNLAETCRWRGQVDTAASGGDMAWSSQHQNVGKTMS